MSRSRGEDTPAPFANRGEDYRYGDQHGQSCPSLRMNRGEEDADEMQGFAEVFENAIAGSRRVVIEAAAHIPNLERPAVFDALVLDFLAAAL